MEKGAFLTEGLLFLFKRSKYKIKTPIMKTNHTRSTLSLFLIILFYSFLHGQAFQQRYAYNPGPGLEKGYFWDVTTLPSFASNNVNIITIGASTSTPNVGVLGF
ncbi:MAG TPA: hypothetical protein ENJ82_00660, partial [Bacteroidetes bacterium]|nr:hypothetical protein [Bacteroidota bacterium]